MDVRISRLGVGVGAVTTRVDAGGGADDLGGGEADEAGGGGEADD